MSRVFTRRGVPFSCEFYADLDYDDNGRQVITREHVPVGPKEAAEKVRRWGDIVELEPMNAFDRRIVHNTLKDDPTVETHSVEVEGTPKKAILLRPRHGPGRND